MKLTLGFSPCPNDTFIFDALVNGKIDTHGIDFEVVLADVEALNQMAIKGALDITKLSYHAFAYVVSKYSILDAGSALGNNCGPLLISKKPFNASELNSLKIAIPGKLTTANFLLSLAYPKMENKIEYLFSDIEKAIENEAVDAGLIIHENRFTYEERGFLKIRDLGEFWEETMQLPIPLGGICIKKSLPRETQSLVNSLLKESVEFAFNNPDSSFDYVKKYAQEMEAAVMKAHIGLYVNEFSRDLGSTGKKAIEYIYKIAIEKGIIPPFQDKIFI